MVTPSLLRSRVEGLTFLARRDLSELWRRVESAVQAEEALRDILPSLIAVYGDAAAAVAADWYDELRAKSGADGRFSAVVPAVARGADPYGTQPLVGWALAEVSKTQNVAAFASLVEGGMHRRIANRARATVTTSSLADPAAVGWKRIGAGACEFCRMLIERDQLYTAATADFASHDDCNCQAYPLIKGAEPIDVKDYLQSARSSQRPGESDDAYERRRSTERARARDWIATHDF